MHELSCQVAEELEQAADPSWLWKDKFHAKIVDGFTITMPDTSKNQAEYPQQKAQKPGIGFPIARAVAIVSLATVCVTDFGMGPYKGKETGESALLRSMLGSLKSGDSKWMDEETYATIPEQLVLREIRYNIVQRGRRTRTIDVITTLIDVDEYSKEDIAELCGLIAESRLEGYLLSMLKQIANSEVANRPGRLEPRVLKRRRHGYKLMQKPLAPLRAELRKHCT